MAHTDTWDEPFLPWVESENDRRFKRIAITFLLIATALSFIVPFLPTLEPVQKDLKSVSPRLAKLILEKKQQSPPVKKIEKNKVQKKKVTKKPAKKKKKTKKQIDAMEKASNTGLIAMSNELMDLRESFDFTVFDDVPLKKTEDIHKEVFDKNIITSNAQQDSGGIKTSKLTRSTGSSKLATRSTTQVESSLVKTVKSIVKRNSSGQIIRPQQEIEQVFQKNKGIIYSIYNRALRRDPSIQGKVILELTIASNGRVIKCRIISSELNNPKLERKLVARIKLFKFKAGNAQQIVVKYPIDFLPS